MLLGIATAIMAAMPARAQRTRAALLTTSDSADVIATVDRFHAALAHGDSSAALALLAPDVVILESGDLESREDYRHHHLPADIAFTRAVPGTRQVKGVIIAGDAAWLSGTSVSEGKFNGRTVNSAGAELMVLSRIRHEKGATRTGAPRWQIRAIHWSSHRRGT
jgi:ketosteroid isomerase-like protein